MPPRSKVTKLPTAVKAWLDQALVDSNFSGYEQLSAELAERGYSIGKSALNTYGQRFAERLSALKMASEQAKAVVDRGCARRRWHSQRSPGAAHTRAPANAAGVL